MIVKICFGYPDYGKYMVCSAKVGRNIKQLQLDFDKWLRNRVDNLPHLELVYVDEEGNKFYGEKKPNYFIDEHDDGEGGTVRGVSYGADTFVYYLNYVRFNKGKRVAKLIDVPNKPHKKTIVF
jgi:hypothetical protein